MDTHFKDALNISNMLLPCTGCTSTVVDEKSTKLAQDMCQMYKINREKKPKIITFTIRFPI